MFGKAMLALGVIVCAVVALLADVPVLTAAVVGVWAAGTPYAMLSLLVGEDA